MLHVISDDEEDITAPPPPARRRRGYHSAARRARRETDAAAGAASIRGAVNRGVSAASGAVAQRQVRAPQPPRCDPLLQSVIDSVARGETPLSRLRQHAELVGAIAKSLHRGETAEDRVRAGIGDPNDVRLDPERLIRSGYVTRDWPDAYLATRPIRCHKHSYLRYDDSSGRLWMWWTKPDPCDHGLDSIFSDEFAVWKTPRQDMNGKSLDE